MVEVRAEVRPPWPFRLGGGSLDGLQRRRGAALQRLLRIGGEPVLVGIVQPARDRVVYAARGPTAEAAAAAIARMRFATGVDDDLRPFYDRFRDDPVIGRAVRANPGLRVRRKCQPWEALVAAICEQLETPTLEALRRVLSPESNGDHPDSEVDEIICRGFDRWRYARAGLSLAPAFP